MQPVCLCMLSGRRFEHSLKTFRGQFWWTDGTRWEGCELIECNIGGGEEIKGYKDGGPPTLCQPASQQGGGEEVKTWQEEPGGGWRSAGVFGENFWFLILFLSKMSYFHSLGGSGVVGLAWTSFWLTQWNERRQIGWKWKFYYLNCFVVVFYIVSAWYGLVAKVLANKWE